jgi:S-adenosylmethionine:tRNA ribosyltransferase-isomerase
MDEVLFADKVIVLNNGEIAEDGSPKEIFSKGEEIKKYGLELPLATYISQKLKEKGVEIVKVLLHVGLGTFRPVKADVITDHKMHSEFYQVTQQSADAINKAKSEGRRIVACGTTSVRVLESASTQEGVLKAESGFTEIFIYPSYKFKMVDSLITNFHLPESTLVMLVSAFMGKENALNMYESAVKERYRFFSFGDSTLIL